MCTSSLGSSLEGKNSSGTLSSFASDDESILGNGESINVKHTDELMQGVWQKRRHRLRVP